MIFKNEIKQNLARLFKNIENLKILYSESAKTLTDVLLNAIVDILVALVSHSSKEIEDGNDSKELCTISYPKMTYFFLSYGDTRKNRKPQESKNNRIFDTLLA